MGIVFESALAARFVRPDKLNAETERAGTLLRRFLADADSFAPFRGWVDPDAAAGPLSAVKAKAAEIRENADVFVLTGTPGAELERLATANGNLFLAFPETVGGRYSATSPVGLFPMAAAGLDIDRLLAGARDLANLLAAGGGAFDMAAAYAGLRHALFGEGFVVDRLDEYHFGQLFQFFLAACTASALLLGVHPFTQDGVEEYKNRMFAALEKPL